MKMDDGPYDSKTVSIIRFCYILAIIFWFLVLYWLGLYNSDCMGLCILAVPVILFLIAFAQTPELTKPIESVFFQRDLTNIGIILLVPLGKLIEHREHGHEIVKVLIAAIGFCIISTIDVWTSSKWVSIVRHLQSILQTYGIVLVVYALYSYFLS